MFNDNQYDGIDSDIAAFWAFIMEHFTPNERWYWIRLIHLHDAEQCVFLSTSTGG